MEQLWQRLRTWEGLLLGLLIVIFAFNTVQTPAYLTLNNQLNVFQLSIEKLLVVLTMALIIINGEIDLSVASVMGMAACVLAALHAAGVGFELALALAVGSGVVCGLFNGFWIAYMGLPSLAVTLAGLIGYRGVARILLEDRSIGAFPAWFNALGQQGLVGPFSFALLLFVGLLIITLIVLQFSGFGRYVYVIGNNQKVARFSGVQVRRVKLALFIASSTLAALAGVLLAARLGSVRGNTADGFELDIITMVLLGGVSIFGGTGTLTGVGLAILVILHLRNGMSLANLTGNIQTGVIGVLLIGSVLVPQLLQRLQQILRRPERKEVV